MTRMLNAVSLEEQLYYSLYCKVELFFLIKQQLPMASRYNIHTHPSDKNKLQMI